ncbi:MAG: hypothetical protein JWR35_1532 [Marmoricola sp.]|nr:hypothetical protein [Marmoricola sp.]
MSKSHRPADLRTDVQGLRAIAVSMVVIYHLSPKALPGGFVGVDVFFAISGFLITSHLLSRLPRGPRDLAQFWSRRIRRLLPASLLVITCTIIASRLVAPETQWANTAKQARASALYVVNWVLARDSVDYLAAENAASPVQHFWSLAVEEQFYFVWPILILLLALLARRTHRSEARLVAGGLVAVTAASLVYSIHQTSVSPASAYFVTPTRIWELGIGGLLAALLAPGAFGRGPARTRLRPLPAVVLAWLGIAAIAWSAVAYSGSTPFPGWQAGLPVVGTALVIAAQPSTDRRSPGPVLALRPMQWLGDVSYSVYLWHWPLIVLVPQVLGRNLDNLDRAGILVATLVLAWLTKTFVEDPFRSAHWGLPLRKPYLVAAGAMALVVGLTGVQLNEITQRTEVAQAALKSALAHPGPCFGAAALTPPRTCKAVPFNEVVPAPAEAASDKSSAYGSVPGGTKCSSFVPDFPTTTCTFGDKSSKVDIALVGNSHATEWLPTLQVIAAKHHWRITTYLSSRCALSEVHQKFEATSLSNACLTWVKRTVANVAHAKPDLVVMANRLSVGAEGKKLTESDEAYTAGYRPVLGAWHAAGLKVLALHDTPFIGASIPDCLAEHTGNPQACDGARADWVPDEPVQEVVKELADPNIEFLDLTDHICDPKICHAITGGVITYFDGSHLTATYAKTLAPYLEPAVRQLIRR